MIVPPILIFGYGNPSRGDDALAPRFLDQMEPLTQEPPLAGQVELLTDYQLQIEHALDLRQRQRVLFVDASLDGPEPFDFQPLKPDATLTYTTHAMSPAAVLAVYEKIQPEPLPPCFLLAIRGYVFDLGEPLSAGAQSNLSQALTFARQWLEKDHNAL